METVRKLGDLTDETLQSEIASKLFGKSFQDLIPLLKTTQEQYNSMAKEARDSGLVIPEDELRKLEAMGDKIEKFKLMLQYRGYTFIEHMMPTLERLAKIFEDSVLPALEKVFVWIGKIADDFGKLSPDRQEGLLKLIAAFAVTGPILSGLGGAITLVGTLGKVLAGLKLPAALISGLGAIAALGGGLITAGYALQGSNIVVDATRKLLESNQPIPQGQGRTMKPGTSEYAKFKAEYYATHPVTTSPQTSNIPPTMSGSAADEIIKKQYEEGKVTDTSTVGTSPDTQALIDALSGGGGGAKYEPSTKQEALKKLLDANQITVSKYLNALMALKTELYKGFGSKSTAKLQAEKLQMSISRWPMNQKAHLTSWQNP
jgi:hypothetical protein